MKKLFTVAIGEANGEYFANVSSLTDSKNATVSDTSLKRMLPKMNKLIRGKARQERFIPMPRRNHVVARSNGQPAVLSAERN